MGPVAAEAIPTLNRALQDPAPQLRFQAAQALWEVNHPVEKVLPALLAGLKENNLTVRRGHVKEVIPVLLSALKNYPLRLQAVEVLGKAGPEAKEALPALVSALQDVQRDHLFAGRLGSALAQIGGAEGVKAVLRTFAAAAGKARPVIEEAPNQTGPAGVEALVKLVDDEDPAVRVGAVRALGQPGRSATACLAHKDKEGRPEGGLLFVARSTVLSSVPRVPVPGLRREDKVDIGNVGVVIGTACTGAKCDTHGIDSDARDHEALDRSK
jgi:HEAT repeat protein